jgi:hypothetical protein
MFIPLRILESKDLVTIMWANETLIKRSLIQFQRRYNMTPLKVMTVVGTRPEIIRLSAVIKRLDQEDAINHILVHTGQNYDYELNQIFFDDLELRAPDVFLEAAGETA